MIRYLLPLSAVVVCLPLSAQIVSDSFAYTSGEQLDDENAFWTPDNDGSGISVVNPAFTGTASPFAQTENSIALTSGRSTHLDITTVAETDYFFSFSIQPGTFDGGSGRWKGLFLENGSSDLFAGFDENSNFITQSHTSPVDSGIDGVAGNEYFILGKATFSASLRTYTISASVFSDSSLVPSSEPVTWDSTDSFSYGNAKATLTEFRFNSRGATSSFDDALMSSTFADVVPEPSSYALISGVLALGWIMLRRRK